MTSHMEDKRPKILQTQPVEIKDSSGNVELSSLIEDLSPTSREKTLLLLQSLRKNEAIVGEDDKGRPVIQYKDEKSKKIWWDASYANMMTQPRTDSDVQIKMDACLELIEYLKKHKPPSGVVLDPTHVQSKAGYYREGKEFNITKDVLGKGNSAGDIIVIKDKKTGAESAHKTMMISVFRQEEIRAWVDLNETGIPPYLYSFKLEGNRIHIFMEKIDKGITLRDVIDIHMSDIWDEDPSLVRPFSLYIFHGLLSAVHTMHQKGWTHRDLHPGNIMLQESPDGIIETRILDFGMAKPVDSQDGLRGFRSDLVEVIRKFTALYLNQEFDSETDVRKKWKHKVTEMADLYALSREDKAELFCLIESALQVASLSEIPSLKQEIADKMNFDAKNLSKRVAQILFKKPDIKSVHPENLDEELEKIKLARGKTKKTGMSTMDSADIVDSRGLDDDYFTPEEIDDSFLENLRKQTGVGC